MNAMQLLAGPVAQAIGWALLHLLWQATIVAGILAAVLALMTRRSANARYAVSCAALAIVFVMFAGTAIRAYDPATPAIASGAQPRETISLTRVPVVIAVNAVPTWRERIDAITSTARRSLPLIVGLWMAGVVLLSSRLLLSWIRTRRLAEHGAVDASVEWQCVAKRISDALGLRRAVRLLESAAVEVPSVLGTLRPVILLPASTLTGLTPEQLEMVLAHELAHIRRHDFLINLLQAFVETMMFYHPAVWWMSRRVRIERENCCDDLAVAVCGNALQYARALTRLEELRAATPDIVVAANGGSLMERIRRIVTGRAESIGISSRWAAAVAMLSVLAIALALPSLPALAQREETKKKAATEQPKKAQARVEVQGVREAVADPEGLADAVADGIVDGVTDVDMDVETPEPPDLDIELPEIPEAPETPGVPAAMVSVAPRAALAPSPRTPRVPAPPAVAPMPPVAMAMAMAGEDDRDRNVRRDHKFSEGGKLTVDELIQLAAVDVTPAYIDEMRALFPDLTIGEVVSAKAVGVTADYVRQMRAANIEVTTVRDATALMAVDVTPEYLRDIRGAGVDVKTAKEAKQLAAMGVTSKFVKQLADAGYANLSVRELTRLAAAGIDGDYIREMQKYRDKK